MKILNVAHGSFYTFGAYGAATAVGIYFDRGLAAGGFLLMAVFAMALGFALGLILERGVMRLVYGRDEVVMVLVTYAAFLILEDVVIPDLGPGLRRRPTAAARRRQHRSRRAHSVELRSRPDRDRGICSLRYPTGR